MAANKKKPADPKRSEKKSKGREKTKKDIVDKPQSIRRELIGVVLLLLAVFSVIGWFKPDAVIVKLFCDLQKGLFGAGFYILPLIYLKSRIIQWMNLC